MSESIQDIVWRQKQKRFLNAIANHAPFSIRKDLTISMILSLALELLPECPQETKGAWLKNAVDACLGGIQRTVIKEVSVPCAIEVPRQLPIPRSLADGHYPSPSDASDSGCVYAGFTLSRDPLRWHWQSVLFSSAKHYNFLEAHGFTHWLPANVECLPTMVEP